MTCSPARSGLKKEVECRTSFSTRFRLTLIFLLSFHSQQIKSIPELKKITSLSYFFQFDNWICQICRAGSIKFIVMHFQLEAKDCIKRRKWLNLRVCFLTGILIKTINCVICPVAGISLFSKSIWPAPKCKTRHSVRICLFHFSTKTRENTSPLFCYSRFRSIVKNL